MNDPIYRHVEPIQSQVKHSPGGLFDKYRQLTVGRKSIGALLAYECITTLFGNLPGAVGYGLRRLYYPRLFRSVGKGTIFGRNIDVTNGHRINIGKNCIIGDGCELGVKGETDGICIGNDVTIGRGTLLRTRSGEISIGNDGKIGALCNLVSRGAPLVIGSHNLMGAYCYLGTSTHEYHNRQIPIHEQDFILEPIKVGKDVWLGVRTTVIAGSTIGDGCVIGACSLVKGEIPPNQVAFGVPAVPFKSRGSSGG